MKKSLGIFVTRPLADEASRDNLPPSATYRMIYVARD